MSGPVDNAPCEVVVIGMGAAGGLAAALLAREGVDVVGLEAGGRHSPADYVFDEVRQIERNDLGAAKVNGEIPTVRVGPGQAARQENPVGLLMMNGVGGSKIHSTNISWRLLPWNFESRSASIARYGHGAIPAESTIADWPLAYKDLAPYYDFVEQHYEISGLAGVNPFEGERAGPYPSPPLRRSGWTGMTSDAAERLGWHPFPTPASIRTTDPSGAGRTCQYCGQCTWNGCWADAKAVPSSVGLPEAEASGNLRIVTEARVTEILVDAEGSASGVSYVCDGRTVRQPAKWVLLAGYTYENTRLLLLSRSAAFPRGLANNADQVGRHFSTHAFLSGFGLFPGRRTNLWSGTGAQSTAVDDFNGDNFDHSGVGFVGGSVMMACQESRPMLHRRSLPPWLPRWGAERKDWLRKNLRSIGFAYALPDALTYEDDRLDLDPAVCDRYGVPVVRVTQRLRANERRQSEFLAARLGEWMLAAGASETWHSKIAASPVSTHAYGGTRMGTDPTSSVVDPWCFAHEVPNLVIAGASCFPGGGGVNPTQTVEAVTWRTIDRLLTMIR